MQYYDPMKNHVVNILFFGEMIRFQSHQFKINVFKALIRLSISLNNYDINKIDRIQ